MFSGENGQRTVCEGRLSGNEVFGGGGGDPGGSHNFLPGSSNLPPTGLLLRPWLLTLTLGGDRSGSPAGAMVSKAQPRDLMRD